MILFIKSEIPRAVVFLKKSHISSYTKKDGTFVAAHEDKRVSHADEPSNIMRGKDGKPLVLYHGSPEEFDDFDESYGGIYFAEDPSVSEHYATHSGTYGEVKKYHVVAEKVFDATAHGADEILDRIEQEYDNGTDYKDPDDGEYMPLSRWVKSGQLFKLGRNVQNEVMESLSAEGYDAVRYVDSSPATGDAISIVVFDPKNIKII